MAVVVRLESAVNLSEATKFLEVVMVS